LSSSAVPHAPPPKTYIDTMVFIYHFMQHGLSSKANKFFQDIEKGKYAGVTTSFTITEYLGVMRKALTEARNKPPTSADVSKLRKLTNAIAMLVFAICCVTIFLLAMRKAIAR